MNKFYFIFLIFSILPISMISVQGENNTLTIVIYSKFDRSNNQWTNLTISNDYYSVSSDNDLYDDITGQFAFYPWNLLNARIQKDDFFNKEINDADPDLIIEVEDSDRSHIISINLETFDPVVGRIDNVILVLDSFFDRVTGLGLEVGYWPVDINIVVLESFPEQFAISVVIQRANDLLAVVNEIETKLIVSDYDLFAQDFTDILKISGNITYVAEESIKLNSGGDSAMVTYATFSVGPNFSPSDLFFSVVLKNGAYIFYRNALELPNVGKTNIDVSDFKVDTDSAKLTSDPAEIFSLPVPLLSLIAGLFLIPILKKFT